MIRDRAHDNPESDASIQGIRAPLMAGETPALGVVLRLCVAIVVGGACSLLIWRLFPAHLPANLDVVGYPAFANFNDRGLLRDYDIAVVGFPLLTVAAFVAATMVMRRVGFNVERPAWRNPVAIPDADAGTQGSRSWVAAGFASLVVGGVLGLGAGVALGRSGNAFAGLGALCAAGYAGLAVGVSLLVERSRGAAALTFRTTSRINALVSPSLLLLLAWASSTTGVEVLSTGTVDHYPWLPWWLAAGAAALLTVVVARGLLRGGSSPRDVELRAVALIAVPIALFLSTAYLPGALPSQNVFEDGQQLAAAKLVLGGQFYWRDILSLHGLLRDVWSGQIGWAWFGNSRWGALAGGTMLVNPLSIVALYYLVAYLCWKRWLWVVLYFVLAAANAYPHSNRSDFFPNNLVFGLWPLALLLLAAALRSKSTRGRVVWAVALACLLVFQAVISPETAYALVGAGLALVAGDVFDWQRKRPAGLNLLRSLSCLAGGVLCAVVLALFLAVNGALKGFIDYYRDFIPGHDLTGAHPYFGPIGAQLAAWFGAQVAALVAIVWYFAFRVYRGVRLSDRDLVVGATAITAIAYFPKFFDRMDPQHLSQVYPVVFPVILYLLFRLGLQVQRKAWAGTWISRSMVAALILLVLLPAPLARLRDFTDVAQRYRPTAPAPAMTSDAGYQSPPSPQLDQTARDVEWLLRAYLGPHDWVFDFSNQPGLYYYILGLKPETQYYHVDLAETSASQEALVSQLESRPPKIVVFDDQMFGSPEWDWIVNSVRHYEVSRYILKNYHPLISVDTQLFYIRNGAGGSPLHALGAPPQAAVVTTRDLYFDRACDWGSILNYLGTDRPPPGSSSLPVVQLASTRELALSGWVVDPKQQAAAWRAVAVHDGTPVGYAVPNIRRAGSGSVHVLIDPFSRFVLPLPGMTEHDLSQVRVYGMSYESTVGLIPSDVQGLGDQAGPVPSLLHLPTGSERVVRGATMGAVDSITALRTQTIVAAGGRPWSSFRWLQVSLPARSSTEHTVISDEVPSHSQDAGYAQHTITFDALPGPARTFDVPVASCPQWYGYGTETLTVSSDGTLGAPTLALVR